MNINMETIVATKEYVKLVIANLFMVEFIPMFFGDGKFQGYVVSVTNRRNGKVTEVEISATKTRFGETTIIKGLLPDAGLSIEFGTELNGRQKIKFKTELDRSRVTIW